MGAITPYIAGPLMLTSWGNDPILNLWFYGAPTVALIAFDPSPTSAIYLVSFVYGLQYLALFGAIAAVWSWVHDVVWPAPEIKSS
jgi:hypothetical protein